MPHHDATSIIPLTAAILLIFAAPLSAGSIWIEGEDAAEKNVTRHGWYDDVRKDGLSGRQWLSHYDPRKPGTATYEFTAPGAGEYTFWWRGNVLLSKVSYRIGGGEFREIDFADKRGQFQVSPRPAERPSNCPA
jgi:hypothetical protein